MGTGCRRRRPARSPASSTPRGTPRRSSTPRLRPGAQSPPVAPPSTCRRCRSARRCTGSSGRRSHPPRCLERSAGRCTTHGTPGASFRNHSAARRRPGDRRNPRTPPGRRRAPRTVRRWSDPRRDIAALRRIRARSGTVRRFPVCHAGCPRIPEAARAHSARSNRNRRSSCPSLPRSGRRPPRRATRPATPAQRSTCGRTRL
jgi:hypothetical protein